MNITRKICSLPYQNVNKSIYRKFRFSATMYESSPHSQPQVLEEKFDFEDLKVLERTERRKAQIPPFMKNVFVSVYNRELLAYPEILNKEESECLDERVAALDRVFSDPKKTLDDRKNALKSTKMYAAPVSLTNNGLAVNHTESLRYLETIGTDLQLGQEMSDHWVALNALKLGLHEDSYQKIIDDLTSGEQTITLCIKERIAERLTQADFSTMAEPDNLGVWHITGEKICSKTSGYYLVLCVAETRLKMFLVHPKAQGVSHDGTYVTFMKTQGTPLDMATEETLAGALGVSRLHTAALCRCSLLETIRKISGYIRSKAFSGKPLAEVPSMKAAIGDALVKVYASESAEYFTAGLLDGYIDPDAELEMAMCRNFIAEAGLQSILKLIAIPNAEMQDEGRNLLDNLRNLTMRGETMESVNMFVGKLLTDSKKQLLFNILQLGALNGIHHAGKVMSQDIKQMRNPVFNPTFILKKMISDRHQENDRPKLTLFLAEHLHPTLRAPSEQLEYSVLRMKYACETLMARHGVEVTNAYLELSRLAEAATEILMMTAVLARASRAYCIGLRNAENEMKMAACFVEQSKHKVQKLIKEIDDGEFVNLDKFLIGFGKKGLEGSIVEKPTARTFW